MITVWKCADCFHANKGEDDAHCYWCNSTARATLHPVREPNQQQGTPSYEALVASLKEIEDNRYSPIPLDEQINSLIAQYFRERETRDRQTAEKGDQPCLKLPETKTRTHRPRKT